ncbi:MAG TPA: tetratricopeptide repeat protein [Cyclobacteriaceae bacterium]|nr:tetratricopeptide repeat protein [Cyclobacteriaceae bacterium]
MLKRRILLVFISLALVAGLYFLPKSVVENDSQLQEAASAPGAETPPSPHAITPVSIRKNINRLRARYLSNASEQKNAIFADSLVNLYSQAGQYDSSAWFAERATTFLHTEESLLKAGNAYYEAYTFAVDRDKQNELAEKARFFYAQVLEKNPHNLAIKTKMAMTYLSSGAPMQVIAKLREVLAEDPANVDALYNMGMLSIQSGQFPKAVEWLEKLVKVDAKHLQGQLMLGVAYMNTGQKDKARQQFEQVKKMDQDPAVQAAVDSYLKDLN